MKSSFLQTVLFGEERLSPLRALELTAESLREYGCRYRHWAIAFSGGKDSGATVAAVLFLLKTGQVPAPESLTIFYADTRMELPPLQLSALRILEAIAATSLPGCRITCEVVLPAMDDRFYVYMFGRGVPPPKNRFRWCTSQLKIEPMMTALAALRASAGEKILMLTGVRVGESAARDQRIAVSCSRDGSECGQGWFQTTTPAAVADTLAPCLHWRVCTVWDWLMDYPASDDFGGHHGLPTQAIADAYVAAADDDRDARTGCVGCNLASRDIALERVVARSEWDYLAPLTRLRPLYADLTQKASRLRKDGETKKDGTPAHNQGRLGPLTMAARRRGIDTVSGIQAEINANAHGRPLVTLINDEELARIEELIAANTWPERWTGDEITGDTLLQVEYVKGGGRQHTMAIETMLNRA